MSIGDDLTRAAYVNAWQREFEEREGAGRAGGHKTDHDRLYVCRKRTRDVIRFEKKKTCEYALQRRRKRCWKDESQGSKVPIKEKSPDSPHMTPIDWLDSAELQIQLRYSDTENV